MAKLILYQAKSPYPGDITKNCALTGKEVDNNFLNLKGEDIKTIYLDEETKKITFTRFKDGLKNCNGEPIEAKIEIDLTKLEYVTGYKYEDGVIKITYSNGKTAEMPIEAFGMAVATDSTISGNGSRSKPLSISQAMRTGQYQPVEGIIDITEGERLPDGPINGEGYVTREIKSSFGLFYTSDQALKLQEILMLENSEWRVPTKKDWDTLLNYLEDCDKYKNHSLRSEDEVDARGMKLGNLAGFKAKSLDSGDIDYWNTCGANNGDVLRIYPTGSFSALTGAYSGFGDHAHFWTLTEGDVSCRNFYSKKFIDCVGTVTQIEEMPAAKLTIRLVKNFLGDNYHKFEDIHGRIYETELFASESEECNQVWTMVNIDIQDPERDLFGTPMPEDATSAITTEYAYYVNRWDGYKWDKHEMTEGDCIVVLDPDVCSGMSEYRLECGELVNRDAFWQDQLDNLSAITEDLQSQIDAEVSARTEADEHLQEQIDELSGTTDYILETIGSGFTPEHSITEVVGDGLSGITLTDAIIQLQEDLIETAETLYDMITAETQAREEADEELYNMITAETQAREEADEELHDMITAETRAREEADEKLQEEIDRIEEGVGLDEDGNYIPKSGTTYLDDAESVEDEIAALDEGLAQEVEDRKDADQEIKDGIGNVNDIPTKKINEYKPEDFFLSGGTMTVFEFINSTNDYGYWETPNEP